MVRSHAGRGALLSSNLPQLQNLIKRDPKAYKEEFLQQWNHYHSILKIFQASHEEETQSFRDIVAFISQLAPFYPDVTANFPAELSSLLLENYGALDAEMKKSLISNLIILRKKDVVPATELLKTLFPLLPRTTSSTLRSFIRKTILSEIRTANLKRNNLKLNRAVQAMLFRMIEQGADAPVVSQGKGKQPAAKDTSSGDALWAVFVTKDLWKKGTWNDAKSVSIISMGCLHPSIKVQSASLHFFLDEEDEENSSDEEEDIPDVKALEHRRTVKKKTRSGDNKLRKTIKTIKKKRKKSANEQKANFAALQLLNDPQTFAEKLYDNLNRNDKRYLLDHKLLLLQVMCRTMGTHKLCVLGYYTYIMKYLTYHQLRITAFLLSLAQSVHDLTPPDVLTPVVRKIAQEFVHPGVGGEVIAAGLNTIREVCKRQPWCMEEDLLGDLVEYRKSKDKAVMMASRSLLQLYRQTIPSMLKRRERGKEVSMKGITSEHVPFGHQVEGATEIEGLALLENHLKKAKENKDGDEDEDDEGDDEEDDEGGWSGWEVDSDSESESSESEGWIDVSSDEENELVLSDSEDEGRKKATKGKQEEEEKEEGDGKEDKDGDVAMEDVSNSNPLHLATTKILTPADFALINDLKQAASKEETGSKRKRMALQNANAAKEATAMTEDDILGPRKKAKATYEERMESIKKGREDREKFGSSKGKKKKEAPSSTTNKQKAKNKPIMMVLASGAVRGKKKASLREKQKRLRAHTENQKKRKH